MHIYAQKIHICQEIFTKVVIYPLKSRAID